MDRVFKLSIAFFPFHLDESDDCWTLAAVMQLAVKLAKACNCEESQLSTELLQDESDRQAVARRISRTLCLSWLDNGQAPFNCTYEIEDCQHDFGCVFS